VAITVPNVVKVTGSGVTTVTTSGVTTTTGSTFTVSSTADFGVTINTPTDSKSNTYGALGTSQVDDTSALRMSVFYKENGTGGTGHTATVTYSGSTYPTVYFSEVSGAATASYDSGSLAAATDNNGSPHDVTSGTFAQANNAVLTWVACDGGGTRAYSCSGFTVSQETDGNNYWTGATGYKLVTATTAQLASWVDSSTRGLMKIVAFKEAAGGGPTTTTATAAAGVATVSGVGSSRAATGGSAAGTATVSAVARATAVTTATAAAGSATVSAVGAGVNATAATAAAGVATVSAAASSNAAASGSAAGLAAVSGAGASLAATVATPAAGTSVVSGVGSTVSAGQTDAVPAAGSATVSAQASSIAVTSAVPAAGSSTVSATAAGGDVEQQLTYSAPSKRRERRYNYDYSSPKAPEVVEPVKAPVKAVKQKAKKSIPADMVEMLGLIEASQSVTAQMMVEQAEEAKRIQAMQAEEDEMMAVIACCL